MENVHKTLQLLCRPSHVAPASRWHAPQETKRSAASTHRFGEE
jgi:hypothetical protein